MPAFIRYPIFGCLILALSACGGSGSSRLLGDDPPASNNGGGGTTAQERYKNVDYLLMNADDDDDVIGAAREKFGTTTTNDDGTTTPTPAPLPSRSGSGLSDARDDVVLRTNRYLSTGGTLVRTEDSGNIASESIQIPYGPMAPGCSDETATDAAQCKFPADKLREEETSFSFGLKNSESLRFAADRQPVMSYRGVDLSQVRTADAPKAVYQDDHGNEYLLTSANVTGKNLDDVDLPTGVTTAPDFDDLLAVYEDGDGNDYLLTSANVSGKNLDDLDDVPADVTFASLSVVRRDSDSDYVGYDGILQYSMFFVGVDRFYDEDADLQHIRFTNASLGKIYDDDTDMTGIQMPTVSLTGEGAMVGVESRKGSLEHYLVQGDVEITYDPLVAAGDMATPPTDDTPAMIDIEIKNIKRLTDDGPAWYAGTLYSGALTWENVVVTDSKFSAPGTATASTAAGNGKLLGSLYGTKDAPEVGGVFHHGDYPGGLHEIIGSFGSKLTEPDEMDDLDPMDQ